MFGLHDDQERARTIGTLTRERRERDGLSLADVARETGVSAGTIKRFEQFAEDHQPGKPIRYEPWGAEYLERWLAGTLTAEIILKHDIQRLLERNDALSRKQIRWVLPQIYGILDNALGKGEEPG